MLALPTQSFAAAPIANDDQVVTDEDTPINVDVLANDTDADHDALTVIIQSAPSNGAVGLDGDFTIAYTPGPNFNGTDSFVYKANDGTSDSNTATVLITVNPINDLPIANDEPYGATRNIPLAVESSVGVLANDVDGDALFVDMETVAGSAMISIESGNVAMNVDGSFTYVPLLNFSGNDSFGYVVSGRACQA